MKERLLLCVGQGFKFAAASAKRTAGAVHGAEPLRMTHGEMLYREPAE